MCKMGASSAKVFSAVLNTDCTLSWRRLLTCRGLETRYSEFRNPPWTPVANRRAGFHPAPDFCAGFLAHYAGAWYTCYAAPLYCRAEVPTV